MDLVEIVLFLSDWVAETENAETVRRRRRTKRRRSRFVLTKPDATWKV
jgi:hypothetical protein